MSIYDSLNQEQRRAVFHTEGPLLILAGAGSGKTSVLTHRIAYLIDECGINPWNILAITFTNKAAEEMRSRVDALLGFGGFDVWISTFHSTCVRILRRDIEKTGRLGNFTIYDADDQRTVVRQVAKEMGFDRIRYPVKKALSLISQAKNEMISPEDFPGRLNNGAQDQIFLEEVGEIYKGYENTLEKNNALDFDDLIIKTVELFKNFPEVLAYYQNRFRYIMVDEYQDTDHVQFEFVSLLAKKHGNICVVGDDDQSIYRFRGADVHNILDFEEVFPGATLIRLEQNYRSTQNILDAANSVIRNNRSRKEKSLWTLNDRGSKILFKRLPSDEEEAAFVINTIRSRRRQGSPLSGHAVLYRTNAQSRKFEERCVLYNIPYRLIGGVNFYQRKEIKDILAYLRLIDNPEDEVSLRRVINKPKRGIGEATIAKLAAWGDAQGIGLYEALKQAGSIPELSRFRKKLMAFGDEMEFFRLLADRENTCISELIDTIVKETGYGEELMAQEGISAQTRLDNIGELVAKAKEYESKNESRSLGDFLREVSLVADVDNLNEAEDKIILMTLHGSKGLEFDYVFLTGMDDEVFPSASKYIFEESMVEEERRLCYVGITRAKKELTLTSARKRFVRGSSEDMHISRFVREIPRSLLETDRGVFKDDEPQEEGTPIVVGSQIENTGWRPKLVPASVKQPSFGKAFTVLKMDSLPYEEGDRVRHATFGEGIVREIKDGKKDYEVTVDFDRMGIKRMFASFAKLEKL